MSETVRIKEVIQHIEQIAPPVYQEGYDNAGLIVGQADRPVTGVLVCLDSTETIIDEAEERGCNLVIAHHPIVFKGLKSLTGKNYVERTVIKAIQKEIAIYAAHTNLDHAYRQGVNARIAEKLGLTNTRLLAPKQVVRKLSAFVAPEQVDSLRRALVEAGAGQIMTIPTSFSSLGVATRAQQSEAGIKLEINFAAHQTAAIRKVLMDYQEKGPIFYDLHGLDMAHSGFGAGMIGELSSPQKALDFLKFVKKTMKAGCVRHTDLLNKPIQRVAVCGGAGGFLLNQAIAQGAEVFITADYKYHEFFDADGRIIIADIGHYESEQYTIELLQEIVSQKFSTFAAYCTDRITNPVNYL